MGRPEFVWGNGQGLHLGNCVQPCSRLWALPALVYRVVNVVRSKQGFYPAGPCNLPRGQEYTLQFAQFTIVLPLTVVL